MTYNDEINTSVSNLSNVIMIMFVCQISGAVGGSSDTAPGERRHDLSRPVTILMWSRERAKLLLLTVSRLMGDHL